MRQPLRAREKIAEHALQIRQHLVVPVADNRDALLGKPLRSTLVGLLALFGVLSAVHFDDEPKMRAIEIDGVWSQWMLPSERKAVELIASQRTPQSLFRVGHIAAEISRACGDFFCAGKA